jgi:Kelch motif
VPKVPARRVTLLGFNHIQLGGRTVSRQTLARAAATVAVALLLVACGSSATSTSTGSPEAALSTPPSPAATSDRTAASSAQATPTAWPTVAVLEPGTYARVVTTDLVYRTAPRIADDSEILGKLEPDARVYVAEGPVKSDGFQWFLVQVEETWTRGWVAAGGKDGEEWLRPLDRAAGEWVAVTQIPDSDQRDNLELAVATDGELIYTVGGLWPRRDFGTTVAPSLVYAPATDEWLALPEMPTPRLYTVAVVGPDANLYVIGGSAWYGDSPADSPQTMEFYSPGTGLWTTGPHGPSEPSVNTWNAAAVSGSDDRLHLFYADANATRIATYDTATRRWSDAGTLDACTDDAASGARGVIVLSGTGGTCGSGATLSLVAMGGGTVDAEWSVRMAVDRSNAELAVLPDGRFVVAGGDLSGPAIVPDPAVEGPFSSTPLVEAYDPESGTWTTLPPLPRIPPGPAGVRTSAVLAVVGGELYAMTPDDGSTLYRLDLR